MNNNSIFQINETDSDSWFQQLKENFIDVEKYIESDEFVKFRIGNWSVSGKKIWGEDFVVLNMLKITDSFEKFASFMGFGGSIPYVISLKQSTPEDWKNFPFKGTRKIFHIPRGGPNSIFNF